MSINTLQTLEIIEALENFIDKKRPPEHIRKEVDLSYKIEDQSVIIFEIRPKWNNPEVTIECNIAKTTFVKSKNQWNVFWQRADLKWHSYSPNPILETLNQFLKLVEEDKFNCFWG
jgi:Protein of unknown function (DUF3024)